MNIFYTRYFRFLILYLIISCNKVLARNIDPPEYFKGQIIKIGEPSAFKSKKQRRKVDYYELEDDLKKFYHIFSLGYINRYFWDGITIQANDDLKQKEYYYNEIHKQIEQTSGIRKSIIKIDSSSFSSSGYNTIYPNRSLSLMIDTTIINENKIYLIAYWINELGFLDSPIEDLRYSLFFSQTGKSGDKYTFIIADPESAVEKGEIILTDEKYKERITLFRPIRAVLLFTTGTSKIMLIFWISIYCLIVFIVNRLLIRRRLDHEIDTGKTVAISKNKLVARDE